MTQSDSSTYHSTKPPKTERSAFLQGEAGSITVRHPRKVGPEWVGPSAVSKSDPVLAFASDRTTHDDRIGC